MWYLLIFIVIGIVISKEFRNGVGTFLGSLIVFTIVILIGLIYSPGYSIYMPIKEKKWNLFFIIWWRLIDGTYSAFGDMLKFGFAYRYDELANVWGEWVEDASTTEEKTTFGDKQTTLSASVGFLEYMDLYMTGAVKGISNALNFVFKQTRHAIGSWEMKLELKKLKERNLYGNK
ncbi:MAG: hypothetical protein JKY43_10975 [Phycisphaerales bacterium]|nr:hypothetical protein [Phycisphaerales bacterium]